MPGEEFFFCGHLDVPHNYLNDSETRIVGLPITKLQASGLAHTDISSLPGAGIKSQRTLVIEPGGPGKSGIVWVFGQGETLSARYGL